MRGCRTKLECLQTNQKLFRSPNCEVVCQSIGGLVFLVDKLVHIGDLNEKVLVFLENAFLYYERVYIFQGNGLEFKKMALYTVHTKRSGKVIDVQKKYDLQIYVGFFNNPVPIQTNRNPNSNPNFKPNFNPSPNPNPNSNQPNQPKSSPTPIQLQPISNPTNSTPTPSPTNSTLTQFQLKPNHNST